MMIGKKAAIFDMDGSLVDSMWIWPKVDRIYMEKYGLTQPDTFHKDIEGRSYTETAQYFVDTFPTLGRTREQVMQEWRDMTIRLYATKVFPKPGAMEFLNLAKETAFFSALPQATTGRLRKQRSLPGDWISILILSALPVKFLPGNQLRMST